MSGIVGILHLDGAPVDRKLLEKLTAFQSFRGPDAQTTWLGGNVGFGHTLLRTTEESASEHQPFTLDGNLWIVADCRVDARHDLIAKLKDQSQQVPAACTDVELILRAYTAWGEDCVQHLLGDFAFAIYDKPRRRLFCARDQMGVKPFYYAHIGPLVIFSNTLDCIRRHPAISHKLNDLAIADFLLFKVNQDFATTSFADIQRLPPAHCATWSRDGLRVSRYWTMPIDEPAFYSRAEDYCDRFKELLREVVGDRIRTNRLGILMSGGLDSPTLAVTARDLLRERSAGFDLRAFTVFESRHPVERHYAELVANYLGIPIDCRESPSESADLDWERSSFRSPQPVSAPWSVPAFRNYCQQISMHARVFFNGEGADNALFIEWRRYLSYLARQKHYGRLFSALFSTVVSQRRPPYWGRVSRRLFQRRSEPSSEPLFPAWLNPGIESRLDLRARWEERQAALTSAHPFRPKSYASFQTPSWQLLFGRLDPESTGAPFEVRYPYMDLRMLGFLLTVPPLPWCRSKYLMRRAMRRTLPKPVLGRSKEGVPDDRMIKWVENLDLKPIVPAPGLISYVDPARVQDTASEDLQSFGGDLRVRSLNLWLQNSWKLLQDRSQEDVSDAPISGTAEGSD